MAKWTVGKGLDEWIGRLQKLDVKADDYIGEGIYYGAKIVADQIKKNIKALPLVPENQRKGFVNGVTPLQKQGLIDGLGIATMRNDNGFVNVKIGMDGYNKKKTKKYPGGQPNAMIARATCSGTSFSAKNDFIGKAVNSTRKQAEETMKTVVETKIFAISNN